MGLAVGDGTGVRVAVGGGTGVNVAVDSGVSVGGRVGEGVVVGGQVGVASALGGWANVGVLSGEEGERVAGVTVEVDRSAGDSVPSSVDVAAGIEVTRVGLAAAPTLEINPCVPCGVAC